MSFIFWGQNLFFTFLSIQTFTVKFKFGFMINVKSQSKWYFSLWDLVTIWVFKEIKNDGICIVVGRVNACVVGGEEVDFSPFDQWNPLLSYMLVFITPPFRDLHLFFFLFFCTFLYYFFNFYLFIFVILFLLSISRNMQHYLMHFFSFFFLYFFI